MTIRWLPDATADSRAIWLHIAAENKPAADAWFIRVLDKVDRLESYPLLGRRRSEFEIELHSIPVDAYTLFYRPIDRGVEVVRILHASRDIGPGAFRS